MKVFDANTHIEKEPLSIRVKELDKWGGSADEGPITHYATVQDILSGLSKHGIGGALVMANTVSPDKEDAKAASETVALAIRGYPNLYGAACVHPYSNTAVYDLEEAVESGLSALMLCPDRQGFELDDEALWMLLERVEEMGIPVVLHTQWARDTETYLDVETLFDVGSSFHVDFLLTHMGCGRDISPVSKLSDLDNIYFETSHTAPKNIVRAIELFGPDRIVFGSDFFCNLYPKHELEAILNLDINSSDKERILGRNLEGLLK
ncbi:MAG: hypothetical protein D6733_03085 [Methanobacteriota archaeon]|nr:MAG: hypothetical protein D6733_03085 [Euryarchaeota archaeon]